MISCGINGFGRFGMHLVRYWILKASDADFTIDYINDDYLSIEKVADIIHQDPYLNLAAQIKVVNSSLVVTTKTGLHTLTYTNLQLPDIAWLGKPDIFLECSGKQTDRWDWSFVVKDNTKHVIVSATSWTASQILVYGYNHDKFAQEPVVSYGSCTVNAYVPIAASIQERFGIIDSDVNVIHNVPHHQLSAFDTLQRKACTLESVAPHLLEFVTDSNFKVNYTLVPYDGVSLIDFRFNLEKPSTLSDILAHLRSEVQMGSLKDLYGIVRDDKGPARHKFTTHSAVLIEDSVALIGNNLYIQVYFDNENSVNRYYDLIQYISKDLQRVYT